MFSYLLNRILAFEVKQKFKNCIFVKKRVRLLKLFPRNAVCAEVGFDKGGFSQEILEICQPRGLHLIDNNKICIQQGKIKFTQEIVGNRIFLHCGDSVTQLGKFPDRYFDWVYLDANFPYDFAKKDLEMASIKIKNQGLIVVHGYNFKNSPGYGIKKAVDEFCIRYNYKIIFFAYQPYMYNDVVLRK